MEARKRITIWCTYALVVMSVAFAVIGFTTGDKNVFQIAFLIAILTIFSWFLSEMLETFLEHKRQDNWRQYTTLGLGLFLLGIEIHLVHFGVEWLFPELDGPKFIGIPIDYLISAGFSTMTVFAKATFGYQYPPEEPVKAEDSELADILEGVGGTTIIDDFEIVDRTMAA